MVDKPRLADHAFSLSVTAGGYTCDGDVSISEGLDRLEKCSPLYRNAEAVFYWHDSCRTSWI